MAWGTSKRSRFKRAFTSRPGWPRWAQGPTDWAQVLRLMAPHLPDDSWAVLEHVLSPEEARASVAFLRAAAAEAGVDARLNPCRHAAQCPISCQVS